MKKHYYLIALILATATILAYEQPTNNSKDCPSFETEVKVIERIRTANTCHDMIYIDLSDGSSHWHHDFFGRNTKISTGDSIFFYKNKSVCIKKAH